jgi:hypothetical protein
MIFEAIFEFLWRWIVRAIIIFSVVPFMTLIVVLFYDSLFITVILASFLYAIWVSCLEFDY